MNGKFYKNCDYTGKILKISCLRCNSVKFDIHGNFFFGVTTDDFTSLDLEKCRKECNML